MRRKPQKRDFIFFLFGSRQALLYKPFKSLGLASGFTIHSALYTTSIFFLAVFYFFSRTLFLRRDEHGFYF